MPTKIRVLDSDRIIVVPDQEAKRMIDRKQAEFISKEPNPVRAGYPNRKLNPRSIKTK